MDRLIALLLAIGALCALPAFSPGADTSAGGTPPSGPAMVSVTRGGIHLSLQLWSTAYPRNVLVLATIRLTNHTSGPISTWDCLRSSLSAQVFKPNSVVAYYPPLLSPPGAPWSDCPGRIGMGPMRQMTQIPAGHTLTRMTHVVLRAFAVRAWALLMVSGGQMKPTSIQTPSIQIRETAIRGPAVRILAGHAISARVSPVPGGGPILYSEYASCLGTAPNEPFNASATFSLWTHASATVLRPFTRPCASVAEWMLFVAQPGLPVARAYYCSRHDRCAYAPPTPQERRIVACKLDVSKVLKTGRLPRSAARYAIGLSPDPPSGLTRAQQPLAIKFHARCAPLLARHGQ